MTERELYCFRLGASPAPLASLWSTSRLSSASSPSSPWYMSWVHFGLLPPFRYTKRPRRVGKEPRPLPRLSTQVFSPSRSSCWKGKDVIYLSHNIHTSLNIKYEILSEGAKTFSDRLQWISGKYFLHYIYKPTEPLKTIKAEQDRANSPKLNWKQKLKKKYKLKNIRHPDQQNQLCRNSTHSVRHTCSTAF